MAPCRLAVLTFGAVLFSVGLNAGAAAISRRTRASHALSLTIVVLIGVAVVGLAMTFFGSVIAGQIDELIKAIPDGFRIVVERVQANPYGRYALEQARSFDIAGSTGWIASTLGLVARSTLQALGYAFLVFFLAIYLAAEPDRYRRMCLRLLPPRRQPAVSHVFDATGDVLRRWLIGQLVVMFIIGVLSGVGFWLLGINSAIALGLVGGFLCFIPYVGAVLAAVPATLVAADPGADLCALRHRHVCRRHFVGEQFHHALACKRRRRRSPPGPCCPSWRLGFSSVRPRCSSRRRLTLFLMVVVELLYVEEALRQNPISASKESE